MPYTTALPLDAVGAMVGRSIATKGASMLQYSSGQGDPRLRELICEVMALEGISAHSDDVVVTVGSQQGLDLVTRIFCDPHDVVIAEAPSYVGALGTFAAYEADVVHVEMDDDGLVPAALESAIEAVARSGRRAKMLYTIPNFHNPAGVTLAMERRPQILEICRRAGLLVVEDNPYGLLGFDDEPYRAMRADDAENVVYLGSFSKTFAPGLRVGWVLAPHAVREKLVLASEATILCPPAFTQHVVAEYLTTQPWTAQVKAFREIYRERRDAMLGALEQLMPSGTHWTHPKGGFYVWVTLPGGIDAKVMQPRAIAGLVAYVPGIGFYSDGQGGPNMRLSYCYPPPDVIREGIRRLAAVVEQELDLLRTFGPGSGGDNHPGHPHGPATPGPDTV
jgi:DNA-binding transcriptional MocR family regulator